MLVRMTGVTKQYGGLRPLRIERLEIADGDRLAILGFDQPSAEVFVNLITGATLADAGEIAVFDRPTSAITDASDWLSTIDRLGIVSPRAVLLDGMTVIQNLAVPFTLDIEPPPDDVRSCAEALAREAGIPGSEWNTAIGAIAHASRARVRLARALALDPALLIVEHASADVPRSEVHALGRAIRDVAARRGAALVAATADPEFAKAVADRVLTLEPATGRLKERRGWFR
jgi:ABC-type transporter Mla maintaining outer membrane lipid asymmetry ATPase subunit MlaF